MSTSSEAKSLHAALRQRFDGMEQAIREKNLDALMAYYAPDVVVYDVFPPLETRGAAAYRKNFERWFSSVQGPIDYRMQDLHITQGGGLAVSRFVSHIKALTNAGQPMEYSVRVTTVLENKSGDWLVTHEHISMPAKR
jgi:ketosteroid isomerase-like protein